MTRTDNAVLMTFWVTRQAREALRAFCKANHVEMSPYIRDVLERHTGIDFSVAPRGNPAFLDQSRDTDRSE